MDKPTIHLTNWSTRSLHRGRVYNIMAKPRHWEHGNGNVPALTPSAAMLDAVRGGEVEIDDYREALLLAWRLTFDDLQPGALYAMQGANGWTIADGDTLCCACSKAEAALGRCHRVWAAKALARVGWRVILDGAEVSDAGA
jgi:hypothetical protein